MIRMLIHLCRKALSRAEIVASVNGDISGKYELKRGQSVDIYYLRQKGESIKSLRVPENIIRYIVYTNCCSYILCVLVKESIAALA